MGKLSKRYNEKARQVSSVDVSNERKKNEELAKFIDIDSSALEYKLEHDTSNALVTQSNENKNKQKPELSKKRNKILTKKQKKKLECLQARKQKEKKRGDILKSLSQHQLTPEELSLYKSTTTIGQGGTNSKRKTREFIDHDESSDGAINNLNSIKKRKKKQKDQDDDGIPLPPISSNLENESASEEDSYEEDVNAVTGDADVTGGGGSSDVDGNDAVGGSGEEADVDDEDDDVDGNVESEGQHQKDEHDKKVQGHCDKIENNTEKDKESTEVDMVSTSVSDAVGDEIETVSITKPESVTPIYVTLRRNSEIQAARLLLPILPEEQIVMETIQENDVIIICGSTGSGKTTQVPQFLYEAGYGTHCSRAGIIGVTEPRRVAAISMSKRVAEEMNMPTKKVSYQIRFEGNTTDETKIKFMTDGVLLKEMETDFVLSKYSAIIIDEAHERSVYTDILIGMLTRVVPLRKKRGNILKLIIMSATLRIEDFTENLLLFPKPPPVLKVDSRQYPVTIHFNRKTHDDYLTEAFKKVCKIHQSFKLDGGILVFLTGQREVLSLCSKLRKAFPKIEYKPVHHSSESRSSKNEYDVLQKIDLDKYVIPSDDIPDEVEYDDIEDFSSGDEECIMDENENEFLNTSDNAPLHILPLYSLLPTNEQSKVFSEVPDGHRLCVISTNVAETSLTIPGVKYIVDSGKIKSKFFDKVTGVSKFMITWTSKASANQRAGRAGRIGPGHCYRLYSSAVFENNFDEYSEPEIRRRPVDDLVLQMKSMHIDKVINFPFPSPPDHNALKAAEKLLLELGALKNTKTKQSQDLAAITPLGKHLSKIPVSPRFAKMIYLAGKKGCVHYIINIAAALAVKDIFTNDIDLSEVDDVDDENFKQKKMMITRARRKWAGDGPSADLGDLMVILRAVGASEYANCSEKFCKDNGLRLKALTEIRKLRIQLIKAINNVLGEEYSLDLKMSPPTNEEAMSIRQIVLSCFGDHVAQKIPSEQAKSLKLKNAYQSCSTDDYVFIHPTSSMFTKLPDYIVYHEIAETSKLYMKTVFGINEDWLPLYAAHKCHLGKPLDEPPPFFNIEKGNVQCYMSSTYGPHMWTLPPQFLPYPDCTEKYRWFAKFFLDGVVCEKLKQFSSNLLTPSSVMLKSWSHLQQKTEDLLCCFMEKEISDRKKLLNEWDRNPKYVLSHYLKWLPESQHEIVNFTWPPI